MELVFEVLGRGHRQNTIHKSDNEVVTLGRAWDNDIILQDPQVDPHHAVIRVDPETRELILEDLSSSNGTWVVDRKRRRIEQSTPLESGTELTLGRCRLRIYDRTHPVEATQAPTKSERLSERIGHAAVAIPLVILSVLLIQWLEYLDTFSAFKLQETTNEILTLLIVGFAWAAVWSFIGKVVRHEMHFGTHLSLFFLFSLGLAILEHVNELLTFNHLTLIVHQLSNALLTLIAAAIFINAMLFASLGLNKIIRRSSAFVLTAAIVSVVYVLPIFEDPVPRGGNSGNALGPQVVTLTRPDLFRLRSGVSVDQFVADSDQLFEFEQ